MAVGLGFRLGCGLLIGWGLLGPILLKIHLVVSISGPQDEPFEKY